MNDVQAAAVDEVHWTAALAMPMFQIVMMRDKGLC
jgi:hypothetical protein